MASQAGFDKVLASPTMITHIAYSLNDAPLKLRTLASDVLAAVSVLSPPAGHKTVLSALSDYRIAYEEPFRFDQLVAFLRPSDDEDGYPAEPDEAAWEARTATMTLINALTNCPDALEDRIMLREEFGRRGLNEAIVVGDPLSLNGRKAYAPFRRYDISDRLTTS
jgi:diaphanous 1